MYAILTELPAVFLLYNSSTWSAVFLLVIFSVSVWNGGGFYIEVFGRKSVSAPDIFPDPYVLTSSYPSRFERELEKLRKEIAESASRSNSISGASTPGTLSRGASHTDLNSLDFGKELVESLQPVISDSSSDSTPSSESKKEL